MGLKISPFHEDSWNKLALIYELQKNLDESIKCY